MAIARDAASSAVTSSGGASTLTGSITTGSGSNLTLLVLIADQGDFGNTDNIPGVTANGTAMTRWAFHGNGNNPYTYYVYALVGASPSTAYSVVASRSITGHAFSLMCFSYSGTSSTNAADASVFSAASNAAILSAIAANCWAVSVATGATPNSGGTNFTSRGTVIDVIFGDSNGTITTGGVTVAFTPNGGTGDLLTISLAPTAIPSNAKLTLLGCN